jgi:hypothetical protein
LAHLSIATTILDLRVNDIGVFLRKFGPSMLQNRAYLDLDGLAADPWDRVNCPISVTRFCRRSEKEMSGKKRGSCSTIRF